MHKVDNIKQACTKLKEAIELLDQVPIAHYLDGLLECRDELFKRCFPIKVDDKVALTKTTTIDEDTRPGWISHKHLLIEGATGVVLEVSLYKGKFRALVVMDNQTWLNPRTKEVVPVTDPARFMFSEDFLQKESK